MQEFGLGPSNILKVGMHMFPGIHMTGRRGVGSNPKLMHDFWYFVEFARVVCHCISYIHMYTKSVFNSMVAYESPVYQ
jgi:hypothetical protein